MWFREFCILLYIDPIAMKILWGANRALVMLQLNVHEIFMSFAPVINVILYMLYNAHPFVYFDIS
jgi:hypothetical protein